MYWHLIDLCEGASPIIQEIKQFHDHSIVIMSIILILILYLIFFLIHNKLVNNLLITGHTLEMLWTIFPSFILILLAVPRIKLLYLIEEVIEPLLTLKVTGYQWYWSYEYADFLDLQFDSYIVPDSDLEIGQLRNLETDYRVVLPINEIIRVIITRNDVLHCFRIPRIGVKCDAVPGRLNQIQFLPLRAGLFYGQCSEICGANHSFIPIAVEIISFNDFIKWI